MTRCKFTCLSVTKRKAWNGAPSDFVYDSEFSAVTGHADPGDSGENEEFWAATPAGTLKLSTVKSDHFEVGKDYYLDLSIVE